MHIGLILYGSLDTLSGGYLYDRMLVTHLQEQGDQVTLISLPPTGYRRSLAHNFNAALRQKLLTANFDLLLQDELCHPSLYWLNRSLRQQASYPVVSIVHHLRISEHHMLWQRPFYRFIERQYLSTVDGFVYNSQTTQATVEKEVSPRPSLVALPAADHIQPEISDEAITERAYQPGPLRLLFVGNLIRRKNIHLLLMALAQLPRDQFTLTLAGDTSVSPRYTQLLAATRQQAGLSNVTITGRITDAELKTLYQNSHLLVAPSQYEGFGIVYLEGMGYGLPALAGRAGGAGEIIRHGRTGYLLDHEAGQMVNQLVEHLTLWHQQRPLLAKMSLDARQAYLKQPTWTENMARVSHFLQEMCLTHASLGSKRNQEK